MKNDEIALYKTDNLALAPYIDMEGLKYVGCSIESFEDLDRKVFKVFFCFEDPKLVGNELALSFTNSRERSYRNKYAFFRNEIELAKRKLSNSKE